MKHIYHAPTNMVRFLYYFIAVAILIIAILFYGKDLVNWITNRLYDFITNNS